MSYCDDCIHQKVCKYTKNVRDYEQMSPQFYDGTGPRFIRSVDCAMKTLAYRTYEPGITVYPLQEATQ